MEKVKLKDGDKQKYQELVSTAQQIEMALGGATYKVFKMEKMREQVDIDLKSWWDRVAGEYKIDKTKDYYVTQDGEINIIDKKRHPSPAPAAPPAAPEPEPIDTDAVKVDVVTNEEAQAMVNSCKAEIPGEAVVDNKEGGTTTDLT